jgi:hypothetical protein
MAVQTRLSNQNLDPLLTHAETPGYFFNASARPIPAALIIRNATTFVDTYSRSTLFSRRAAGTPPRGDRSIAARVKNMLVGIVHQADDH